MFGGVQGLNMSYQFGNNYNVCNKSKKCLIIKILKKNKSVFKSIVRHSGCQIQHWVLLDKKLNKSKLKKINLICNRYPKQNHIISCKLSNVQEIVKL